MKFGVNLLSWLRRVCLKTASVVRDLHGSDQQNFSVLLTVTMNTHLFHGSQYSYNYFGAGVIPSTGALVCPPGCGFGYQPDLRSYHQPFYHGYCNKFQAFQTELAVYHHLYVFNTSERYHPPVTETKRSYSRHSHQSRTKKTASKSAFHYKLNDDLLELQTSRLSIHGGSVESVATASTGSNQSLNSSKTGTDSPEYADSITGDNLDYAQSVPGDLDICPPEDDEDSDSGMHPRGVK